MGEERGRGGRAAQNWGAHLRDTRGNNCTPPNPPRLVSLVHQVLGKDAGEPEERIVQRRQDCGGVARLGPEGRRDPPGRIIQTLNAGKQRNGGLLTTPRSPPPPSGISPRDVELGRISYFSQLLASTVDITVQVANRTRRHFFRLGFCFSCCSNDGGDPRAARRKRGHPQQPMKRRKRQECLYFYFLSHDS